MITATSGCSFQIGTIDSGRPVTMLSHPGGSPASAMVSASSPADSGVRSDGLSTTAQPAARAGATLCSTRLSGKLNGVIAATTPNGWGMVKPSGVTPGVISSNWTASAGSRRASSAAMRSVDTARPTSTRAAVMGLPASARSNSAKVSDRSATSWLVRSSRSARLAAGQPASIASRAAVTASAACSGLATATRPTRDASNGSCTSNVSIPGTQAPLM